MSEVSEIKRETKDASLYEISYLIVPSISAEEAEAVAAKITGLFTDAGGTLVSSESPKVRPLAYEVGKRSKGARTVFDTAYFGHAYFRLVEVDLAGLSKKINALSEVLRSLLLAIPEDALAPKRAEPIRPRREAPEGGESKPINPEELDKQIEQLVVS